MAFHLDMPAMRLSEMLRRRALLETSDANWSEPRLHAQVGERIPVLEDLSPRTLSTEQRADVLRRFVPTDHQYGVVVVSKSSSVKTELVHTLPSVFELLSVFQACGVKNQIPLAGIDVSALTPADDTYVRSAVLHGRRLALHRLSTCEGQFSTIAETLRARYVGAAFVVARACAELAARTLWLLDPVDEAGKAARYVVDRWSGLSQAARLMPSEASRMRAMADGEAQGLQREGFAVEWNKSNWPHKAQGVVHPSATDQMAAAYSTPEEGRAAYRMLSAFTHGAAYSYEDLVMTIDGESVLAVTAPQIAIVLRLAVIPYRAALNRYAEVTGFDARLPLRQIDDALASLDQIIANPPKAVPGASDPVTP
jgi:hypothetical protein